MEDRRAFEEDVRYVYESLLKLKGEGVFIAQNARIRGRSQNFHQFDVYYEFEHAGVRHKVAIECGDTKLPLDKGRVGDFAFRLNDVGDLVGVVVSRNGYQLGADTLATQYGIDLLQPEDVPLLARLLGRRLGGVAVPTEAAAGEPFWTIMELQNGQPVGYYATEQPGTGRRHIPLLYSKRHAERIMREGQLDASKWGVRGLSRPSLGTFVQMLETFETQGGGAMVLFLPPAARDDADFIAMAITRQQIAEQY